ncbi:hypothetical protein HWV62_15371 [Athelia sp. TMB]|nr:hypothetical protein HWV62_15371 [Athelia sp. TMB]
MSTKITPTSSGGQQIGHMQGPRNDEDIPFPSAGHEPQPITQIQDLSDWQSSSTSKLTSSDKLGALPLQLEGRTGRRSRQDSHSPRLGTHSLPSLFSPNVNASPPTVTAELAQAGPSQHATLSEPASIGKEASRHRVSFDSDRGSATPSSYANVRQALSSVLHHSSDPGHKGTPGGSQPAGSKSPSPSRNTSRATSPLRLFQWPGLHRGHSREEPFIPIDPFRLRYRLRSLSEGFHREPAQHELSTSSQHGIWCEYDCADALPMHYCIPASKSWGTSLALAQHTVTVVVPRHIYITLFLLRLPSLYFSRVARLFEDAEVSKPDIQRMIDACSKHNHHEAINNGANGSRGDHWATHAGVASAVGVALGSAGQALPMPAADHLEDWALANASPALSRFKRSWEIFIDSLLKEWKTQNVVSALLLSAILTMFQIEPATSDPITRTAGLISLICALMSLIYGCMYIIRFSTMRTMYKASRWAEEARRTNTILWWNVWVLLAMPAVWLAWSMILFVVAILSYVWRTGASNDPDPRPPLSPHAAIGPRIAVTGVFAVGLVYLVLIVRTLKSYGGSRTRRVQGRDPLWRIGSGESGLTGHAVVIGAPTDRGTDEEGRRGRQSERRSERGGMSRKDVLQAQAQARQMDVDSAIPLEHVGSGSQGKQGPPSFQTKGALVGVNSQDSAASGSGLGTGAKS